MYGASDWDICAFLWKDTEDGDWNLDGCQYDPQWIEVALQSGQKASGGEGGQENAVEAQTHKADGGAQVMQQPDLGRLWSTRQEHKVTV